MKSFSTKSLMFLSGIFFLSGNIAKLDKEDDKVDAYLLAKAKQLNQSNICEEIHDAYRIQQARVVLINRVHGLKSKPTFNDLTKAIQFNLEKLNCIKKPDTEFCSWNLQITDPISYKKSSVPMNLYLISILPEDQLQQLIIDMPSEMREKFLKYQEGNQKQIKELKKYFEKKRKS